MNLASQRNLWTTVIALGLLNLFIPLSVNAQTYGRGVDSPCVGGQCSRVTVRGGSRWVDRGAPGVITYSNVRTQLDGGGGGPGGFERNEGQQDKQEDPKDDPCNKKGNPIIFSTGNKIEPEMDFSTSGEAPLYLERTYNHYWKGIGIFGRQWISNFDFILTFDDNLVTASCYPKPGSTNCTTIPAQPTTIWSHRPDGRQIKFIWNATAGAWLEDKIEAVSKVVKNTNGTYTLTSESGNVETYSAYGRVQSINDIVGIGWTFVYSASNYLTQVNHTSGRAMLLTWTGNQLTRVTDPAGSFYNYTYLANRFGTGQHLLSSSQLPGAPVTTTTYHYEDSRYLGALTGKSFNGVRYSTFGYDAGKRAVLSKHAGDVDSYSFIYTIAGGQIATAKVTNPLGLQTTYNFNAGNVTSVTGAASQYCQGAYKERTYDANGYEDLVTDFESGVTDYDYNTKGQLLKRTDNPGGAGVVVTDYLWDTSKNRVVKTIIQGISETAVTYTADNLVASVAIKNLSTVGIPGNTLITSYSYIRHPNNMLASVTQDGPLPGSQDAITNQYSAAGDLLSVNDSLGAQQSFQNHNAFGMPSRVVSRGGAYVDYAYDARGRVTQLTQNTGTSTQSENYVYDGVGNLITRSNAEKSVSYNYAVGNNRLAATIHESDETGFSQGTVKTALTYNLNGDVTARKSTRTTVREGLDDGMPSTITIDQLYSSYTDYDELGRLRAQRGNAGQNFRATYDREDRLKTTIDSLGRISTNNYDALGQLISITDPSGGITRFEYDKNGLVTKVTDPRNLSTTYLYDGLGQLWSQNSPDTGPTSFTYDTYGRLTAQNRNGSVLNYSRDSLGRLTGMSGTNAQGALNTRSYSYDSCSNGIGRLCSISEGGGSSMNYGYAASGQVNLLRQFVQGADDSLSFEYDGFNRVSKITYPNGEWVTYGYANGQVSSINGGVGLLKSLQIIASNFTYHPATELLASFTGGLNGQTRIYNYDADTRLSSIQAVGVQGLSYSYNANNEITGINNTRDTTATQSYAYDNLSRLITANNGDSTGQSFAYDSVGNRTSHVQNGQATVLSYEASSNRLSSSTKTGLNRYWLYNNVGNSNGFTGADGVAVGFSYDAFQRINGSNRNGQTTIYTVNALGQRIAKSGPGGNTRFIYGPDGSLLAENNNGVWTNYIRLNNQVVAMLKNGSTYYVYNDHLGRPEVVRNSPATTATTVWAAKNTAFDRTVTQNTLGEFNLGLPGQYYDSEAGTWYNYFRDYDASTGRYIQSDPIGLNGGLNTFGYVGGNPIGRLDPTGLEWLTLVTRIGAVVGCGISAHAGYQAGKNLADIRRLRKAAKEKAASKAKDCPESEKGEIEKANQDTLDKMNSVVDVVDAYAPVALEAGVGLVVSFAAGGAPGALVSAVCSGVGVVIGHERYGGN